MVFRGFHNARGPCITRQRLGHHIGAMVETPGASCREQTRFFLNPLITSPWERPKIETKLNREQDSVTQWIGLHYRGVDNWNLDKM